MICDTRVEFKVSQTFFKKQKKSWILIISSARVYTKVPQTALK